MESNQNNVTPKYYTFRRKTVGNLTATSKVLGNWRNAGITGTTFTGLATYFADSRIEILLPIIVGLFTFAVNSIKELIDYIVSVSDVKD